MRTVEDFRKGMRVRYVPNHVPEGCEEHPDIQFGAVSSKNDTWVFVKYDTSDCRMTTGDEDCTAQATPPWNLEPW